MFLISFMTYVSSLIITWLLALGSPNDATVHSTLPSPRSLPSKEEEEEEEGAALQSVALFLLLL